MPVEFISTINVNPANEINGLQLTDIDVPFLRRYARTLEEVGFDYTLIPYGSPSYDPFTIATAVTQFTEQLRPIVALRPHTLYPTVAAKALATLDQLSAGRAVVHFISGGSEAEQAREGDYLGREERFERQAEYIEVLRKVWASPEPFDHEGRYYTFEDFVSRIRPVNGTIPVSLGGSSGAALHNGGALADIVGLWGEPAANIKAQIDTFTQAAHRAGRLDLPRTWVTFRPIVAATDEAAWERAHRTLATLSSSRPVFGRGTLRTAAPDHPATPIARALASRHTAEQVHDQSLWTPTVASIGTPGVSAALVGSYERVAATIVEYVDLGVDLISIRGYDDLNDAITYGRFLLPLIRQELAHRERSRRPALPRPSAAGVQRAVRQLATSQAT